MVNGWHEKPLLESVQLCQGLTYSPQNVKAYGLLVLRSSNIQNGALSFNDCVYVDCAVDESKLVKPHDILICVRNGSSALIGKSCVIDKPYRAAFGAFMSVLRGDNTGYISHIFSSEIVQRQIRDRSSATINQITKRDFESVIIPIPINEDEQRRIAEALSDVDALIANLEKLIAKKKAIKQGTMQLLLTGKKRLPGFDGEWVEKTLGEFGCCIRGVSYNPDSDLSPFETPCSTVLLRANNIENGNIVYCNVQYVRDSTVSDAQRLTAGDILIAMSSGSRIAIGKTGTFLKKSGKYCVGAFCAAFRSSFNNYLRFLFQSGMYQNQLSSLLAGSSINNLNGKLIEGLSFPFAPTVEETNAIADILLDMDNEIAAFEAKLSKYHHIKTGMMQTLLTAKIRLTEQEKPTVVVPISKTETQPTPVTKPHNQQFEDAVTIAAIIDAFYSGIFPLGRKKVQKLLYLLRRRQDASTATFKKKAAGPYADGMRYKGGEPIAVRNGYVVVSNSDKGTVFSKGANISKAIDYVTNWGLQPDIDWLVAQFLHTPVNRLELLATTDMAMCDLESNGITASVDSVKKLIASDKEWRAKLSKTYFSDNDIGWAITECIGLYQATRR